MECIWLQDSDEDSDTWYTSCRNMFTLNHGFPKENGMDYCCFCGGKLKEQLVKEFTQSE